MKKRFTSTLIILLSVTVLVLFGAFSYKKIAYATYPKGYSEYIEYYSAQYNVDQSLVYAVVKCESDFNPQAVSEVGAKGLMQITDDTMDWVTLLNDSNVVPDPFDPQTNIMYGTYLLSHHLEEFGTEQEALAAYHAGRGMVNTWLSDPQYSSNGVELDYIPYDDTRSYVERVLKVQEKYDKIY